MISIKNKTYVTTNIQILLAVGALFLSSNLAYAAIPKTNNIFQKVKPTSVKSIQLGTACKNNTYKNFQITCLDGTKPKVPKETCISTDLIKTGAEQLCNKNQQIIVIQEDCNKNSSYSTILTCYQSLSDVYQHLHGTSIQSGNTPLIQEDEFVIRLLNSYSGEMTNQQKLDFIDQQITPTQLIEEKEKQYIFRVVHMLWYEKHGASPWSIKNYTQNDIDTLVWVKGLKPNDRLYIPNIENPENYFFDGDPWEFLSLPAFVKLYPLSKTLRNDSPTTTAQNIIRWYKGNFFHAYSDDENSYSWGRYDDHVPEQRFFGANSAVPMSIERLFEERISGCHDIATVMAAMFRSINIPAIDFYGNVPHMSVYLPTLNRFIHGDHIADHAGVPAPYLLLTPEQAHSIDIEADANGEIPYTSYIYNLFPGIGQHLISGTEVGRDGDNLILKSPFWCNEEPEILNTLQQELPTFNIRRSPGAGCDPFFISDPVPIRSIDQLTNF